MGNTVIPANAGIHENQAVMDSADASPCALLQFIPH